MIKITKFVNIIVATIQIELKQNSTIFNQVKAKLNNVYIQKKFKFN